MEPRLEELMILVQRELRRSGFEDLIAAGIVMTGGTSKTPGLIELAEEVFQMPVRLGIPQHVTGPEEVVRNPAYATGVGLLLFGHQSRRTVAAEMRENRSASMWERMKSWFEGNF
jgi:cell division protein FtsA